MPERTEGFYWVRLFHRVRIAEWSDEAWWVTGGQTFLGEDLITVLSERLEPPKESK